MVFTVSIFTTVLYSSVSAQDNKAYIRIAKIVVDAAQPENYKAALKEGMEMAVHVEKGLPALYAVYDKAHPAQITVFERYAGEEAYKLHIQTARC